MTRKSQSSEKIPKKNGGIKHQEKDANILTEELSRETTYSEAINNLANLLDEVYDQKQVIVIKRSNQKNVALIAEDELSSLLESIYLLRSPENAKRLFRSLEWTKSETATSQSLVELKEELGIES
jgi:antitoxin YefM